MSFVKSKLKAARESIGHKNFSAARDAARQVLEYEPENYTAHVFLGLSLLNLGETDESEQVYRRAASLSPDQILAWQGLSQLYEKIDNPQRLLDTLKTIAQLHQKADDPIKTAETLQKIIDITRSLGDKKQLVKALLCLLPDSPFYHVLSGLAPPDPTNPTATAIFHVQSTVHNELPVLEEIVALIEAQETSFMEKEFESRRTRLNAGSLKEVRNEIGREIWAESQLPALYNQISNHPGSTDDLRRGTESKLLRHKVNYLHALPLTEKYRMQKHELSKEIDELIRGVILLKIPDELAWTLYVEEQDCEAMSDYDYSVMKQLIEVLPNSVLAEAFQCYYEYISEGLSEQGNEGEEDEEKASKHGEDPFDGIMNVFARAQGSLTVSRIVGEVYLNEEDYQNASSVAKTALELLQKIEKESGKKLRKTQVGLQSILASALTNLFPPKHHQRASSILHEALSISPENIRCLISQAYILRTAQDWIPAAQLYQKIVELLPGDLEDGLEAKEDQAWCHWQATQELSDIEKMKDVLDDLQNLDGRSHNAARCLWRIGKCYWDLDGIQREEAYSFFIASLKQDSSFAPAFTSLGFFYADVASPSDPVRASKCFQKAFELDPRENLAARKLAEGFAEDREWDLVEVVARRTIEGEGGISPDSAPSVVEFIPTNSWAWKAVGFVEMNRENYLPAIQAFQNVLRAEPEDCLSWSRLGEAYAKAGRQAAAIKALHHALELDPQNWLCSFLIAELKSKTGLCQEAIYIFEELLTQRRDELSVIVALAQAHFALGQTQLQGGFQIRAEASFLDAIEAAMLILERYPGFRGVSWKIISDAALQLCLRTKFHNDSRVAKLSSALHLLLSKEHKTDSRSPFAIESSGPNALLSISIQACHLRVALNQSSNVARGAACYDLAIGLKTWCTRVPDVGLDIKSGVIEAMTNALEEEPTNELYWSTYGNVQFSDHPKVAQHAYIKALELNPKDVATWTNLGLLYYHHGDLELANEALYRAQVVDPDYPLAWLGQALVAAGNGHEFDAYSLLTHAITLTPNLPDVDAEYGIRAFYESKLSKRRTEDETDPIPCFFALDRYCSCRPDDPLGLHLFALICERIGHIDLAISSVERCITILEAAYEESENLVVERQYTIASTTLGRLLLSAGQHERSLESFQTSLGLLVGNEEGEEMTEHVDHGRETILLRVQAHLGLALAHFMLRDYSSSLTSSQAALSIAGDDLALKAQIMILLTQTLWALGTDEMKETAKAQLLEYIAVDSENIAAINALAGMGILTEDENLIDAALSEVLSLSVDQRQELDIHRDVDYLVVQHHLSKGMINDALSVAQKEVFLEPGKVEPRIRLANLMIQSKGQRATLSLLSDAVSTSVRDDLSSVAAALRLHSVALCSPSAPTQNLRKSLREIQRAIMLRPFHLKSWQALAYIRSCMGQ